MAAGVAGLYFHGKGSRDGRGVLREIDGGKFGEDLASININARGLGLRLGDGQQEQGSKRK